MLPNRAVYVQFREGFTMKEKLRCVLGFRSGKPWKMILAVLYYCCCLAVLWFGMTLPSFPQIGAFDRGIELLSVLIIFLWMLSPAIFLSDTPMRSHLPLFKKRDGMFSMIGMMIVFLFFAYLFGAVSSFHTPEYGRMIEQFSAGAYAGLAEIG